MNIDVKELEVMEDIASLAVVTGEKREKYLFWQLEISMTHAKRIDLIVSFLMESGVKMLLPPIKTGTKKRCSNPHSDRKLSWNHAAISLIFVKKRAW